MEIWKRRLMDPMLDFRICLLLFYSTTISIRTSAGRQQKFPNFFLRLNGSEGSFAQITDWHPTFLSPANWSLSLDFRTNMSSGILLYADDNSKRAFIQLRLISSQLECRIQTPLHNPGNQSINGPLPAASGSLHSVVRLGRDLNDNQWHTVLLDKLANVVTVRLQSTFRGDEVKERIALSSGRMLDGPTKVFLGGLPANLSTHFSQLAHPSVVFETRFTGVVGNFFYGTGRAGQRPQLLMQSGVTKEVKPSLCEADGLEKDIIFSGMEHLFFTGLPSEKNSLASGSQVDARFSFQFRSRQSSGLLAFVKRGPKVGVALFLSEDCLVVTALLASGDADSRASRSPCRVGSENIFRDFSLHNVTLEMKKSNPNHMVVTLDGNESYWTLPLPPDDRHNGIGFNEIYLGGSPSHLLDRINGRQNIGGFQGSLSKVILRSGFRTRNLHDARKLPSHVIKSPDELDAGITYDCLALKNSPNFQIQFQFCDSKIFLVVPEPESQKLKQISLRIKTTEPNGLILFYRHQGSSSFTAVDLSDGNINVFIRRSETEVENAGSPRITVPSSRIDDGKWHNLTVAVNDLTGTGFVKLDDAETEFVIAISVGKEKSKETDLTGNVYVGGAPSEEIGKYSDLWSVQLNQSFRGFLEDIQINSHPVDDQVIANWNEESCPIFEEGRRYCDPNPCFNSGMCREGWLSFVCDCSKTSGYGGQTCAEELTEMNFNGTFLMAHHVMSIMTDRQVSDISFRLRTGQADGFLLRAMGCPKLRKTQSSLAKRNLRKLDFMISTGRLVVRLSLEEDELDEPFEWVLAGNLSDRLWHSVKFSRRGPHVRIAMDQEDLAESISALEGVSLTFCQLEVGGTSTQTLNSLRSISHSKRGRHVGHRPAKKRFLIMPSPLRSAEGFFGTMQGLVFDDVDIFHSNRSQKTPMKQVTEEERLNAAAFSFQTSAGFLELETLQAEARLDIRFSFRTSKANGLFLFNGKPGKDFIAVELARGNLHFIFDLGNGAQILRSSQAQALGNKAWHTVHISRPSRSEYSLSVDNMVTQTSSPVRDKSRLDLSGKLYLGGIPKSDFALLPRSVVSRQGYLGCLRELTLNGLQPDLGQASREQRTSAVVPGCSESGEECRPDSCKNGGRCEHQGNGVLCDCDMTSYSGPVCQDYSIAYRFGPVPGLIIYHFDPAERLDSRSDRVAFGLITVENEAIIGRVASFTSEDVIEFQIVGGHLFVIYNMGKMAHLVTDLKHRLNDGQYHVIRFERSGANASIQIDTHSPVTKEPVGPQLDVFNGISTVEIGGKLNEKQQDIERAFIGVISGFVLNGIRILDLAVDSDSNIVVDGQPEIVRHLGKESTATGRTTEAMLKMNSSWLDEMQHMETTHSQEIPDNDDLITAAAPRCHGEDESCMLVDNSKSDDLIFAQYTIIKTTTATPKTSTVSPVPVILNNGNVPCDDEDCDMESSGDNSLLSARSAVARTTRVFYVSFNTTIATAVTAASSYATPSMSNRGVPSDYDENNRGFPRGAGAGVVPAPTLAASDNSNFLLEYGAIIASIAVGIIFLVGLIVFLAVRYRGSRNEVQVAGASGKNSENSQKLQEGGRGPAGSLGNSTVRVNPHEAHLDGPPNYSGAAHSLGRSKVNKDKEWYV